MIRDHIVFYINGIRKQVSGESCFLSLSDYLRTELSLTGTKIVCSEGDCGACSVAVNSPLSQKDKSFMAINSCISPLYLMDGFSIVSIEGIKKDSQPSEIQMKMLECHASQCGFCTPGFVMALSCAFKGKALEAQNVKNCTTGNLCRCTGYESIIKAGTSVDPNKLEPLQNRYLTTKIAKDLMKSCDSAFEIKTATKSVNAPNKIDQVSKFLQKKSSVKIVSSATDLGVQHNKEKLDLNQNLSLSKIKSLYEISEHKNHFRVGARVTLSTIQKTFKKPFPEFSKFLNIFASPQIRNVATLVGNLANGSPIADTVPFLFVMDAIVEIQKGKKTRKTLITKFFKGYKKLDLKKGEWISAILIPKKNKNQKLYLYKISRRRDLDISTVNAAFGIESRNQHLENVKIAYGGVGPTPLRLSATEKLLNHKSVDSLLIQEASKLLQSEITPQSDSRASEQFRRKVSTNLLRKAFYECCKIL